MVMCMWHAASAGRERGVDLTDRRVFFASPRLKHLLGCRVEDDLMRGMESFVLTPTEEEEETESLRFVSGTGSAVFVRRGARREEERHFLSFEFHETGVEGEGRRTVCFVTSHRSNSREAAISVLGEVECLFRIGAVCHRVVERGGSEYVAIRTCDVPPHSEACRRYICHELGCLQNQNVSFTNEEGECSSPRCLLFPVVLFRDLSPLPPPFYLSLPPPHNLLDETSVTAFTTAVLKFPSSFLCEAKVVRSYPSLEVKREENEKKQEGAPRLASSLFLTEEKEEDGWEASACSVAMTSLFLKETEGRAFNMRVGSETFTSSRKEDMTRLKRCVRVPRFRSLNVFKVRSGWGVAVVTTTRKMVERAHTTSSCDCEDSTPLPPNTPSPPLFTVDVNTAAADLYVH